MYDDSTPPKLIGQWDEAHNAIKVEKPNDIVLDFTWEKGKNCWIETDSESASKNWRFIST